MNRKELRAMRKQLVALTMAVADLIFVIDRMLREQEAHK